MRIRAWQAISVSAWVLCLAGGAGYLAAHASTPGQAGPSPDRWPQHGSFGTVSKAPDRWTIVLATHPRCPCTRASADELIAALADATLPYELLVLAYQPESDEAFADTGVIRRFASLDHARVIDDSDGRIAAAFGAQTSGHAAVYAPDGGLRFSGGLTPTRAHVGPNTGAAAVRALLRNEQPPAAAAPVFGCPLDNTTARAAPGDLGGCTADGDHTCTP